MRSLVYKNWFTQSRLFGTRFYLTFVTGLVGVGGDLGCQARVSNSKPVEAGVDASSDSSVDNPITDAGKSNVDTSTQATGSSGGPSSSHHSSGATCASSSELSSNSSEPASDTLTSDTLTSDTLTSDTLTSDTLTSDTLTSDAAAMDAATMDAATMDAATMDAAVAHGGDHTVAHSSSALLDASTCEASGTFEPNDNTAGLDAGLPTLPTDLDSGTPEGDASSSGPGPTGCRFAHDVRQFEGSLQQVVLGPEGSLYLLGADNGAGVLRKLDAQGEVVWTWDLNDGNGPLDCLAVSAAGTAYMTRYGTIYRVDTDGVELPSWSRPETSLPDVAVDPEDNLWVAGKSASTVYSLTKLTPSGNELASQSYVGSGMAALATPVELSVAPNGNVFATYGSGGSLSQRDIIIDAYTTSGVRVTSQSVDSHSTNLGSLTGVSAAVDSNQVVAVAETINYYNMSDPSLDFARVVRLHPDGYTIDGGRSIYANPLPREPGDLDPPGYVHSIDLAVTSDDRLILLGTTNGEFTHPSAGKVDSFIAVWQPDAPGLKLVPFGTSGNDRATSLATSPQGEMWIAGNTDGSFTNDEAHSQAFLLHTSLSSLHCEDESEVVDGGASSSESETDELDAGLSSPDGHVPAYGQTDLWQYGETDPTAPITFASEGNFFAVTSVSPLPAVIQVDAAWNIISSSDPSLPDSAPPAFRQLRGLDHSGSTLVWNFDTDALEKFSADAELMWSKPMAAYASPKIAIDLQDNLLLVWSQLKGAGQAQQFYLTKWDRLGVLQWQQPLPQLASYAVDVNLEGDILVTGPTRQVYEKSELTIMVFQSSGDLAWSTELPMQGPNHGFRAAALDNHLAVSVGLNTEEYGDHVVNVNPSGATAWTVAYPGATKIVGMVADQAENIAVLAQTRDSGPLIPDLNVFVHQLDTHGTHRWVERFATSELDVAGAIAVAPNGDLLATIHTSGALTDAAATGQATVFIRFPANHAPTARCFVNPCTD